MAEHDSVLQSRNSNTILYLDERIRVTELDPAAGSEVVRNYVDDLRSALGVLDVEAIGAIVDTVSAALAEGRGVHIAGNGGSASAAAHMALDWSMAAGRAGCRSKVTNLAESASWVTALGNDLSYQEVFSHQLEITGASDDVLVLLSVSGSSPNLVTAARAGRWMGMSTLGLLGHPGAVAQYCDRWTVLGRADYGLTEDLHVSVNHMVVRALRGGEPHCYLAGRSERS